VTADNEIVLQYLQENTFPAYEEMPVSSRVEVATVSRWRMWDNTPALIRKALRGGKDIAEAITWTNKNGETLLHVFVSALAWNSAAKVFPHSKPDTYTREPIYDNSVRDVDFKTGDNFGMWRELVRCCISAGASLEAVDLSMRTPLQALVDGFWHRDLKSYLEKASGQLEYTLYCWLADLTAAGVDLEKYGATESSIRQRRTLGDFTFHFTDFGLVGFSHGSLVTDWQFWFSNPRDIFAGDFWAMIEAIQDDDLGPEPTLDIPGSWSEGEE
jgi:hypothetical protein